jgi:Methyltransferase domain
VSPPDRHGAAKPPAASPTYVAHIDFAGVAPISTHAWTHARYDYSSLSLRPVDLLTAFPSLEIRDPQTISWPYLRKDAPHIWRSDRRSLRHPDTGVQSAEEAQLLYNNALPMPGRRGLEIGCHYAWSTAHLLAAGLVLDVIDPALGYPDQRRDVEDSLRSVAAGAGRFNLWAGFSPSIVPAVLATAEARWSFVFIDGYHEGRAPLDDAEEVARSCADGACVMFHDLVSPDVAAGLRHFEREGWSVGLYNTMQIMGIAWRGGASPAKHIVDPNMPPADYKHLNGLPMLSTAQ